MDTLVLAQTYEPLALIGWQRAMTLWISARVEILEEYADRHVRTVRVAFPMPSVVRFHRSPRRYRTPLRFSRDNVYARDRGCCQYCGHPIARRESTYDHVLPRSRGGVTTWENIVLACRRCNQRKGARTPCEARMRLLSPACRPRRTSEVWRIALGLNGSLPDAWRPYLVAD